MSEPKLGQTKKSAVESYLRAKREKGQLTDEEIARLDAIGFKWEKRKKKTIEEKVDLYVHYRESGKRWRCNETGERFRSLDDAFRKYGKEGDTLDVLRSRVKKGHTWHGMTITRCQTERPITASEQGNLIHSLKRHLGKGELSEAQIEKLRRCDFPFESIKEAVGLDDRLRAIWDSEQNGVPDSLELRINKEYAWKCPVCGYRWTRKLGRERDSKGCPACLGKVVIPISPLLLIRARHPQFELQTATASIHFFPEQPALQAGGCRRPHRIRVDGQGARVACRRARDACRAAMARTMARSRVDTCLGV